LSLRHARLHQSPWCLALLHELVKGALLGALLRGLLRALLPALLRVLLRALLRVLLRALQLWNPESSLWLPRSWFWSLLDRLSQWRSQGAPFRRSQGTTFRMSCEGAGWRWEDVNWR